MEIARESIFVSSIRAFCNGLFGTIGILVVFVLFAIFGLGVFSSSSHQGLHTTIVIEPDVEGSRALLPSSDPAILVIDIRGPIMAPNLTAKDVQNQLFDSRDGLLKNGRVKGILLHVNTPGGTVTDSNAIYTMLMQYKAKYNIPIYSFTDGLCASGGVYVTSACEKNLASDVSIIGSVGVIMGPAFNYVGLMEKLGIEARVLSQGKDKQLLPAFEPWDPPHDESLRKIIEFQYQQFTDLVAKSRPKMDKEKLISEYGAQVYAAPIAEQLGFIDDGHATYEKALQELVAAAKIEGKYQVVKLKTKRSFFDYFSKPHPFEKITAHFGLKETQEEASPLFYLYKMR